MTEDRDLQQVNLLSDISLEPPKDDGAGDALTDDSTKDGPVVRRCLNVVPADLLELLAELDNPKP